MSQATPQTSPHSGIGRKQRINPKVLQAAVLHAKHKDKPLLFPARSGRLSSRQIELVCGHCLAVAMLSQPPGTAALSFLLDQAVFGSQHMPAHFAAVTARKHFPTKMSNLRSNEACAATAVGSQRVPMRVWCSYVFANPAAGGFPLHRALAKQP